MHEHVLPYQLSILLHLKIQLLHESRVIAQHMHHILLAAAGTVNVPECLSDKVFDLSVFFDLLRTDDIVIFIHCFSS